jgi:penicillin-binding protein 1A
MSFIKKLLRAGSIVFLLLSISGVCVVLGTYLFLAPGLPTAAKIKEVQLQVPLRVYSKQGDLISEYGEKRRKPLKLEETPLLLHQAFLAAEDDRFFEHPGVDYQGLLRAVLHLIKTGQKGQGGSTITMQLTRNFFLSSERTYTRKLREIFLALKVERELSKEKILELYLNKIYLGNRSYGVGAAAEVYYGKEVIDLNLAQISMIAGLPKAPSRYNPIANSQRATVRRNYVLGRMYALGFIDKETHDANVAAPVTARLHGSVVALHAPYVGEMVRAEMVSRFGTQAYTRGINVHTTIDTTLQRAANEALRNGLLSYTRRHGYNGPMAHFDIAPETSEALWDGILKAYRPVGGLTPALVVEVEDKQAQVYLGEGQRIALNWDGMSWARRYIDENQRGPQPKTAAEILKPGDIIRVAYTEESGWRLEQVPDVSGALASLSPHDGSIMALTGGFDFQLSKFNRATQAMRQPGSNFKPFVYSAALEKGYTPASIINDAPVVFSDNALEDTWRPENYSGKFYGPTRLRVALTKSRNLVSIRLLKGIGIHYARSHATRFGFDLEHLPNNLSLALGSSTVTPLQLAAGYTVFANGGYRVTPYFIQSFDTEDGQVSFRANPATVCQDPCETLDSEKPELEDRASDGETDLGIGKNPAPRVLSATNAYQIVSIMKDVIRAGTGRKAMKLGRSDLAGKTGTTNDQRDAWFSGYNADVVATVWIGFDKHQPLGSRETGAKAALPIWIDYMRVALKDKPERHLKQPQGMVTVRIDPQTGQLASTDNPRGIFETFRTEYVPVRSAYKSQQAMENLITESVEIPEQLF